MSTDMTTRHEQAAILERVITQGDLAKLTPDERVRYYAQTCESLGLNPLTRPFEYISLNGKLTLYARRDCADQLRKIHRVSVSITGREMVEGIYVVTARATMPDGRTDESIGAVNVQGLKGDALGNAMMKSETKSKRRVTLSICGLGFLDETEVETVPGAHHLPAPVQLPPPKKSNGNGHHQEPPTAPPDAQTSAQLRKDILKKIIPAIDLPEDALTAQLRDDWATYWKLTIKVALPLMTDADQAEVRAKWSKLYARLWPVPAPKDETAVKAN